MTGSHPTYDLLLAARGAAYYGLSLPDLDLDPYPASPARSSPRRRVKVVRRRTCILLSLSPWPRTQISCHEHATVNCRHLASARVLRWSPVRDGILHCDTKDLVAIRLRVM
jgi:hypothetical protein